MVKIFEIFNGSETSEEYDDYGYLIGADYDDMLDRDNTYKIK